MTAPDASGMRDVPWRQDGLTELESCILGVVWRRSPCSPYAVRREFADSKSAQWSASAGSIYPAIKRLERAGLLASVLRPWGSRGKTELTLTPQGLAALRRWIRRLEPWTGDPTSDPVRTRFFFLDALEAAEERLAAVDEAEERTRAKLDILKRYVDDLGREASVAEQLAALGGVFELEGRLRWLEAVRKALCGDPGCDVGRD